MSNNKRCDYCASRDIEPCQGQLLEGIYLKDAGCSYFKRNPYGWLEILFFYKLLLGVSFLIYYLVAWVIVAFSTIWIVSCELCAKLSIQKKGKYSRKHNAKS